MNGHSDHVAVNGKSSSFNGNNIKGNGSGIKNNSNGLKDNGKCDTDTERSWEDAFLPPPLILSDVIRAHKVMSCLSGLLLDGDVLRRVESVFVEELERGLRDEESSLQMENTYVPELPDGTEEGVFLALDLGGTNFRVLLLELRQGNLVREDVKHYHISQALRMGPGVELFEFLAECVQDFVVSEGLQNEDLSLGFTFSFPMKLHSISSGELITWTKSFKCGGMESVDVAALLQEKLRKRGVKVTVRVLLNDTTGTLVAAARQNRQIGIGVIMGTGCNGCYLERASRVQHWEQEHSSIRDVVVDVEWGAFGDNGCLDFIRTDVDDEVDRRSLLVNSFTFEKYIGGKYLGELLVCSLQRLHSHGLFPATPATGSITTAQLSLFEEENSKGETSGTMEVLREACGVEIRAEDVAVAQYAARVLSNRAAQLVSVCISVLLRRMQRGHVAVAVDGSVYKRHPRIQLLVHHYVSMLAPQCSFSLEGAEDGSGKGSALTAAIAARLAARRSSMTV